jgi:MYXO-CTERM domain-containing protein
MKIRTSLGIAAALVVGTLVGAEEAVLAAGRRPSTGYVVSPPSATSRAAGKRSIGRGTIVYFRREGGKYTLGEPDGRVDTNNIGQGLLTPFECGDAKWAQVMGCLKATFLPYDVQITDHDPGMQDHIETVVAGSPGELGLDDGVGGIAPLGCGLAFDNPVDFAFSATWHCDVDQICWAAAQETAHTLGLDHSIECTDVMTYDRDCSNSKRFRDVDKPCGEDEEYPADQVPPTLSGPRKCQCTGAATQDSHKTLLAIFGSRANTAPTVSFTRPHDGQSVAPGFPIQLAVDDDFGLAKVDILVDGARVDVSATPPFDALAPASLVDGEHTLTARVVDAGGLTTEVTIHVQQQPPCVANDDCSATTVCQQGTCVNGPGAQGGLGAICTGDGDCDSGRCAPGADGSRCVESCDPAASTCPIGFDCLSAGVSSACWPGADVLQPPSQGGGCGCRVGGVAPRASILSFAWIFGIFGIFAFVRRRRRG